MCLNEEGLKTYKDNDNIRIGYKIFKKCKDGYRNIYYDTKYVIKMGEWMEQAYCYFTIIYSSPLKSSKSLHYKAGYHFYDNIPSTHRIRSFEVVVECICENITAIGIQNYSDKAFVAQSYRLMREV